MNTKVLINFAITAKLICVFVLAYAKSRSFHNAAHIVRLGSKGFYILFIAFALKHRLWVGGGFSMSETHNLCLSKRKKKLQVF